MSQRTEDNHKGINIVVLNQGTGAVMAIRGYDTYGSRKDSRQLIDFVNSLPDGRILCFAIKVKKKKKKNMQGFRERNVLQK